MSSHSCAMGCISMAWQVCQPQWISIQSSAFSSLWLPTTSLIRRLHSHSHMHSDSIAVLQAGTCVLRVVFFGISLALCIPDIPAMLLQIA